MDILFVQSSDPYHYYDIISETGKTVRQYARKNNFHYECYIGIKRGYFAWHAAFNRILIFKELLDRGFDGWICYVDADAVIADQNFDLRKYLSDKTGYGVVLTSGGSADFWDVNTGVMFLNARSPWTAWCVGEWLARFMAISDEQLRSSCLFDATIPHDQDLLQQVLRHNPDSRNAIFLETPKLLNSGPENLANAFIVQYYRNYSIDLKDRVDAIKGIVREVLGRDQENGGSVAAVIPELVERQETLLISALYWGLHNRTPERGELDHCRDALRQYGLEYGLPTLLREIIAGTPEAAERQEILIVSALYHGLLGRNRDPGEVQRDVKLVQQYGVRHGVPILLQEFVNSGEFRAAPGPV